VTDPGWSAARRYRAITSGLNEAVERMTRADQARVSQLREGLDELAAAVGSAERGQTELEARVEEYWEAALDELWNEQWMTPRPMPEPNPAAPAMDLHYLDAVVAQRLEVLREAVRRRGLLGRR
jgi:hypothetical protein